MPEHSKISNATLSTRNFGAKKVRVLRLQYGLEIIGTQAESSVRQAFYPAAYDGSAFSITLVFMDWEERERFNEWMRSYMEKTVKGHGFYASMTVHCPDRDFTRVGIPQDQIEYGEGITDVGYIVTFNFVGITDPADPKARTVDTGIAYFRAPKHDKQSRYFYPAGQQLSGAADLEGTIFDTTADNVPIDDPNSTIADADINGDLK